MAEQLSLLGNISLFRSGIWKPRTKPGMFEGVGEIGLEWLKKAKKAYGIPVTVEVATPQHVELALKYEIDVLWIGARTTSNPFSVQQIADALQGINVPVLIKNPINPDIQLWIGALERIEKSGINEIGLIHRGFSSFAHTSFRNPPMWQIPIEMRRRFPEIPLICDPSHICGNRTLLAEIAQKSIDLDFSGIMIESHPEPDTAWSDAQQQITPLQLSMLLNELKWRTHLDDHEDGFSTIHKIREQIDHTDDELITLLAQRMKLSDQIGTYKKDNNITILQTERWNGILDRLMKKASDLGLSEEFIKRYFEAVHLESINHQNRVMYQNDTQS